MLQKYYFSILLSLTFALNSFAQTHYWTGNGGDNDWFNAANWDAGTVPSSSSDVIIDGPFSVLISSNSVTVTNIGLLGNAFLTLDNDFTAFEQFRIESGAGLIWNKGGFIGGAVVQNNGTILLTSTEEKHLTGANLENSGLIELISIGFLRLNDSSKITNTSTGVFQINGGGNLTHQTGNPIFDNEGLVQKIGGTNAGSSYMILEMNNGGIIDVGENQTFLFLSALAELNNMETGTMTGIGTYDITAPFVTPGTISPGGGNVGTLQFINNFSLSPQTKLRFDLFGPNPGEHDVIAVTGFPELNGDILIRLNYTPAIGDEFTIITANDISSCNLPTQVTNTIGTGPRYLFDVICNNNSVVLRVVEEIILETPDFSSEDFQFYVHPNPVSETINLVFSASEGIVIPSEKLSVAIYDFLGREVGTIDEFSETNNSFPRGNLASGLYFVQLTSEDKLFATTKMLIE